MANEETNDAKDPAADAPDAATEAAAAQNYAPDELGGEKTAGAEQTRGADVDLDLVLEVPVNVSLQVGTAELPIRELVKLVEGSVISLDRESTDPMDVLVNGKLIARGEIVIVDDQFGVRLTDVVNPVERVAQIA